MLRVALPLIFGAAIWPAAALATIRCNDCGAEFRPSLPPPVMRAPMSAKVLQEGVGRSGVSVGYFEQADQAQPHQYPLDHDGRVTDLGLSTRWGMPGHIELGASIDYPFFVPGMQLRVQPLGGNWDFGPFLTLELGMNAMPDFHAAASAGFGLGSYADLHAFYQTGKMLDRGYGEYGGGLTLRPSPIMDIELGASLRYFWGDPQSGNTARATLSVLLGNRADQVAEDRGAIDKYAGDPKKALEAGDYESAATLYKRELKFTPDDAELWEGYGTALKALGRDSSAMKAFSRAKKLRHRQNKDDAGDDE